MEEILYTVPEVAKMLKCSIDYVHQLRKAGLIRCMKLGHYKIRKEEINRFLAENEGKDLTDPTKIKDLEIEGGESDE